MIDNAIRMSGVRAGLYRPNALSLLRSAALKAEIAGWKVVSGVIQSSLLSHRMEPDSVNQPTTILSALVALCFILCPQCWAQRRIEGEGRHVAFSPNGKVFAASYGELKLWSLRGKLLATVAKQQGTGGHIAFNHDGTILAYARRFAKKGDGNIQLWNVENPETPKPIPFPEGNVEDTVAVAFSPDGAILAWRTGTAITLWHLKDQKIIGTAKAEGTFDFKGITFSQDATTLAWANPKEIVLWNITERKQAATIKAESYGTPAFSPTKNVLVWGEKKKVVLWDTKVNKVIDELDIDSGLGRGGGQCGPAFSPDGKRLVIVGSFFRKDGRFDRPETLILDFASALLIVRLHVAANSIAFSPDGETLVTSELGVIEQHYIAPPR